MGGLLDKKLKSSLLSVVSNTKNSPFQSNLTLPKLKMFMWKNQKFKNYSPE